MRKLIGEIVIGERFRRDMGDLAGLAGSIQSLGQLTPITIDGSNFLIAGHRRIEALRLLGHDEVECHVVTTLDDAVKVIEAERDENTCRKDMTGGELSRLTGAIARIKRPDAESNQAATRFGASRAGDTVRGSSQEVAAKVGEAIGLGKSTTYDLIGIDRMAQSEDAEEREAGQAAQAQLDGGRGVQATAQEMRERLGRTKRTAADRRSDEIIDRLAAQMAGIALLAEDLRDRFPKGLPPAAEKAKADRLMADLRAARLELDRLIRHLEKEHDQ